jgi:hypothetical protein
MLFLNEMFISVIFCQMEQPAQTNETIAGMISHFDVRSVAFNVLCDHHCLWSGSQNCGQKRKSERENIAPENIAN